MYKAKLISIALLAAAPALSIAQTHYYGSLGVGYTDNEPLDDSLNYRGEHITDTHATEFSLGAEFKSNWAIDISAALSPGQSDNNVDYAQYSVNGFYFFGNKKLRPYLGLTTGYETLDVPDGIDKETLIYGGSAGLRYDVSPRFFGRLEGRLLETRSTNIEHSTIMLEVGYRFGKTSTKPLFVEQETQTAEPQEIASTAEASTEPATDASTEAALAENLNELPPTAAGIVDSDFDGVRDEMDQCAATAAGIHVDAQGCPDFIDTLSSIQSQSGSGDLTQATSDYLKNLASEMLSYPSLKIEIIAYTDNQGSERFNQTLSQKRADAVRQFLIQQSVPAQNLTAQGQGEANPIADNNTHQGRAQNRRVEFIVQNEQ